MTAATTPDTAGTPRADRAGFWMLIAGNVLTIAIGLYQGWPLLLLMWPFWVQSILIGVFSVLRILKLQEFSVEGFKINGKVPPPTRATQRFTAGFFALHFGGFHLAYLAVLVSQTRDALAPGTAGEAALMTMHDLAWAIAAGAVFVFSGYAAWRRNVALDARGKPNIGSLMFLPYLRVVPMHFMIGAAVGGGFDSLLLFGALKTAADVAMQWAERKITASTAAKTAAAR